MTRNPRYAELYRREALRLCRLAERATLSKVRVNLLRTARLYEAMARRAETRTRDVAAALRRPSTSPSQTSGSRTRDSS